MVRVDINCDVGEGFGSYVLENQNEIFKYVTSANIACGFHAGDPSIMRETVEKALYYGVKVGAHPGLPDLQGFGRRNMAISPQEAYDMVVYQVGALQGFLSTKNEMLQHVKPHGALYNMAANDPQLAQAIARAVYDMSPDLVLFGLAESALTKAGETIGLQTAHEVFADRTYQQEGSLTSRTESNALITDHAISLKQVVQMVTRGTVQTEQGVDIPIRAHTVCIHGDGAHALTFARHIYESLQQYKITIEAINK